MPWKRKVINAVISLFTGLLSKVAGHVVSFAAGWITKSSQVEKAKRKQAEEELVHWQSRPKSKLDLAGRLRKRKKDR